jgi:hypothetical protein
MRLLEQGAFQYALERLCKSESQGFDAAVARRLRPCYKLI